MGGQRRVGCRPPRGEKIGEIRWLHNPRASPARRSERSGRRKVGRLVEGRKERTRSRGRRRGKRGASSLGPRAPRKLQSAPRRRESPTLAGHGARRVGLFWRGGWVGWGGLGWVWWVGRGGVVTHGPRATGVAGWRWLVVCGGWGGGGRSYLGLLAAALLGCWMRGHSSRGKGKRKRKGGGSGRSF